MVEVVKERGTGEEEFFRSPHVEKWRMSQRDKKKKCGKRAREKWVKVRTDDRVKNEEGEENPV